MNAPTVADGLLSNKRRSNHPQTQDSTELPSTAGDCHYLEQELRDRMLLNHEVFDFLKSGTLDGLWFWDLENPEHEWMSESFWETLGYDPSQQKHQPSEWQALIFPDDLRAVKVNLELHLSDPRYPFDQVVRYRHRTGHTVWVRCRGLVLRDDSGRPVRMLGAHNDLTPVMQAREELRERFKELTASARSREDLEMFAYAASHDLNEPLRSVTGFVNKLERRLETMGIGGDPEVDQCMVAINRAVERQRLLVKGLLQLSRLKSHAIHLADIDLEPVVAEVIESISASIHQAGAKVHVGQLPTVAVDSVLMKQVFQNLLSNAIKFRSERTPVVAITAERVGTEWAILFTDNGIGFEEEYNERIFGLFERLHGVGVYEGSGLGLGICKRIVEAHGGTIRASGKPGVGATFEVRLPMLTDVLVECGSP